MLPKDRYLLKVAIPVDTIILQEKMLEQNFGGLKLNLMLQSCLRFPETCSLLSYNPDHADLNRISRRLNLGKPQRCFGGLKNPYRSVYRDSQGGLANSHHNFPGVDAESEFQGPENAFHAANLPCIIFQEHVSCFDKTLSTPT